MENKVLQKNIDHIASYDKDFAYKILMADVSKSSINVTKTKKDEYNLIFNNFLIHDNEGAQEEALKIASKLEDKKNTIRIIFGLGLGYLADCVSEKIKNDKIIIYEPNLDLLHFVFSIAQIDAIYRDNVFVCNCENSLIKLINKFSNFDSKISLTFLSSYKRMAPQEIARVFDISQKTLGELIANRNTFVKKAPEAIKNTLSNLKYILQNPDISCLKDIYKGKTALLCCAGPSLGENIEIVKNNKDKFVIFAVNAALKLLLENNINPDFVVDIETIDNLSQFDEIRAKEQYFILEAFCNPKIAQIHTKKTFNYISNENFINPFVLDCLNKENNLKTYGTVSFTALEAAFLMGFDKIILLGQDLAYKNGACYTKNSQYEDLRCVYDKNQKKYVIEPIDPEKFLAALKTPQMSDVVALDGAKTYLAQLNQNICTVKNQKGELVPTQVGYSMFIEYFKNAALNYKKQKPLINLINSSCGGAQIDGFNNIELSQVITGLEPIKKLDLSVFQGNFDKKRVSLKIQGLLKPLNEFDFLCKEFILTNKKLLQELKNKKIITTNAQKLIQKHKEILSKIIKFKDNKNFSYLATVFIYFVIDILQQNYLNDAAELKTALEQLIFKFHCIRYYTTNAIKDLTYCESFVLK